MYGTTWVGETYYRQNADNAAELQTTKDAVGEIARKGSLALVLFSVISFTSSIFLPFLVSLPSDDIARYPNRNTARPLQRTTSLFRRYQIDITTAWGISQLAFAALMILAPFSTSFQFATTIIALCGAYVPCLYSHRTARLMEMTDHGPCTAGHPSRSWGKKSTSSHPLHPHEKPTPEAPKTPASKCLSCPTTRSP